MIRSKARIARDFRIVKSQSPDGDFFDPEAGLVLAVLVALLMSQSPDGDFFDPEPKTTIEKMTQGVWVTVP